MAVVPRGRDVNVPVNGRARELLAGFGPKIGRGYTVPASASTLLPAPSSSAPLEQTAWPALVVTNLRVLSPVIPHWVQRVPLVGVRSR